MLYKCKICEKEFKQKCHYMNHLNRLRPCEKLTKIIHEITPNYTDLTPILHQKYNKLHQKPRIVVIIV